MIDAEGYRSNVGIILSNPRGRVLWARRIGQQAAWQFPQGGIKGHEAPEDALFRELNEEIGLSRRHVEIIGCTQDWLRYDLPKRYIRRNARPMCIGQKQMWYLLRLVSDETHVKLNNCRKPEFDSWRWVNYWHPSREVVFFKRNVYRLALSELAPLLYSSIGTLSTES